jgi:hypothetical protein
MGIDDDSKYSERDSPVELTEKTFHAVTQGSRSHE